MTDPSTDQHSRDRGGSACMGTRVPLLTYHAATPYSSGMTRPVTTKYPIGQISSAENSFSPFRDTEPTVHPSPQRSDASTLPSGLCHQHSRSLRSGPTSPMHPHLHVDT